MRRGVRHTHALAHDAQVVDLHDGRLVELCDEFEDCEVLGVLQRLCGRQRTTCNRWDATDNRRHAAENGQHATCNRQQRTCNREQTTENREQTTCNGEQTTCNREQTTCNREQTTENREQTTCNRLRSTLTALYESRMQSRGRLFRTLSKAASRVPYSSTHRVPSSKPSTLFEYSQGT